MKDAGYHTYSQRSNPNNIKRHHRQKALDFIANAFIFYLKFIFSKNYSFRDSFFYTKQIDTKIFQKFRNPLLIKISDAVTSTHLPLKAHYFVALQAPSSKEIPL